MFNELEGMMQKVTSGEIDGQTVGQAADARVGDMNHDELKQQVTTAANNASQNGSPDVASQLFTLVQDYESNPQGLKSEVVTLLRNNPQIVQHFAPEFAQTILSAL
ncbi:MAG: hypothetical protein JO241_07620 [Candidatus Eremiobacteraeota bacterium]|nr:hypothetical protein [Candidatus Eremiobacteraeota bacterium]